jgi:hypothetical protein
MSESESRPSIPAIITTAITIAAFAALLSTQRQQLSLWEQIGYSLIIGVSGVLLVIWVWSRPVGKYFKTSRRNRIARKNYSRLVRYVERFREFAGQTRVFSPHNILDNLKNTEGFRSVATVEPWWLDSISSDLERGIKTLKPNLRTFAWGVNALMSMIRFYNEVFVIKPVLQVRAIVESGTSKLPPNFRDNFNASRERLVGFMTEYEEFVSQTNKELGQDKVKAGDTWTTLDFLVTWHLETPKAL